eukprot:TRINITY_DN7465_c0_g1_i3.p1 TRINITY_DN7465_c0_g1~~TRINITY_DN7465_c0_g1_i3.p1  ORF type:complete len:107 (+),score=41.02 TRINITY_DN7465_c0_g1_i3:32-352(+)
MVYIIFFFFFFFQAEDGIRDHAQSRGLGDVYKRQEDVRDEMEDMIQDSNYINEELNRNFALDVNEAELNDDMKQLDDELLFDQLQSHKQQQPNFVQENKQQQVNQL